MEIYAMSDMVKLLFSIIPVGFAFGFLPYVFGLGFSGVCKLLKSI